jgi:putative ABC transport system permease protein
VSLGSFSRYAVQSVFRNRRRTFAAIIGVLLAVTLVAGENIAIDTTASSVFRQMLDSVAFDFEGTSFENQEITNGTNALANVPNVENVEPVIIFDRIEVCEWGYTGRENVTYAEVKAIRDSFRTVAHKFGFETDPTVPSGQVVLTDDIATHLEVLPGDEITVRYEVWGPIPTYYFLNLTVAKIAQIKEESDATFGPMTRFMFENSILINLDDLETFLSDLGLPDPGGMPLHSSYYIWVDRDSVVVPGDPAKTEELLTRMHRDLSNAGAPYNINVRYSELGSIVQMFYMWMLMYRAIFLALAIPAVVLGVYLGIIGAELGLGERRREIGILKARGATSRQIFTLLITEAIVLGVIAGILGIVFGALTSNLFSMLSPIGGKAPSILEMTITEFTIILAIIMAIILLIFATYRPAKRASALPVTETLQRYSKEEAAIKYKPTRDLIFIGLAVFAYSGLLFLKSTAEGGSPLFAVMCLLGPFVLILTPFAPFFLIIGVTSFLTRFTTKIYGWTSRATKFFTKDLYDIVNKNIVRNPRRASSVCVLIAMGLAFGIIVSTMGETQAVYLERSLVAGIGGDMIFSAYPVNRSFSDQIRDIDGVGEVAEATSVSAHFGFMSVGMWAINSADYWSVAHPDSYFFKEGDPRSTISSLSTYGNIIINEDFASSQYVRVNDVLTVEVENVFENPDGSLNFSGPVDYELTVVGIVKVLPGFGGGGFGIYGGDLIFVDYSTLNQTDFGNQSMNFIVDVSTGYDPAVVGDEIQEAYPNNVLGMLVYKEELEKARSDPITGAIFNFLVIEFAFALLIIGLGLGLIMYVAATEREGEFASIMSRGASSRQVARLLLGEAVTIIIIGVVIGLITGLITAFVFNELLSFGITGTAPGMLERPLIVSYQTIALIITTIVILIVASLVASLRIKRMKLAQALRRRGG